MLFALVVMAGVLLVAMVVNNRRTPSRWEGDRSGADASPWVYGGADSGSDSGGDCASDGGGGGCDGGGGGSD